MILEDAVVQSTRTVKTESHRILRVAHSPDADDRFMFWPLRSGRVEIPGYSFEFVEADTQTLNEMATAQTYDICAISALHIINVFQNYQPLLMGASVGDNYGPVVLSHRPGLLQPGNCGPLLLTPGVQTTAHSVLRLLGYVFSDYERVQIVPMQRVFDRLRQLPDAHALVIHEGRLTYAQEGFHKVLDLGEAWTSATGCSLPLGINVIKRHIANAVKIQISEALVRSCRYAMQHKSEYIDLAQDTNSPYYCLLTKDKLNEYLNLYANETTVSISQRDQDSFQTMVSMAQKIGYTSLAALDWV